MSCMEEIVESLNKNGYYVDNGSIYSKCFNEDVREIMHSLMTKHNITESKIIYRQGFNKTIGFYIKTGTVYFLEKND